MVSKASEDFPEPERPVNTTSLSRGISTSMFLRLCSRAPRIEIARRLDPAEWSVQRAALQRRLLAMPGKQLVIVRYGDAHDPRAEGVYDDADLLGTRVLWARGMSPAEDCRLLAFERKRRAWLLEVIEDASPPRL